MRYGQPSREVFSPLRSRHRMGGCFRFNWWRVRSIWGCRRNQGHAQHDMTPIIASTGSCEVTPRKHRLLQHSRASPVNTTHHDPEASCSSPDRCEGRSEDKICSKIGQSVSNRGSGKAITAPYKLYLLLTRCAGGGVTLTAAGAHPSGPLPAKGSTTMSNGAV